MVREEKINVYMLEIRLPSFSKEAEDEDTPTHINPIDHNTIISHIIFEINLKRNAIIKILKAKI